MRLPGRIESRTLLAILLVAAALWAFGALASEVMEGDTGALDRRILLLLRTPGNLADPIGPLALETAMRDLTALGGVVVLTLVTLATMGWLALRGRGRSALFLGVALGLGQVLSHLVKGVFQRPRPDLVPYGTDFTSTSFPSGHSMMAAATWLTLALMIARAEPSRRIRAYILTMAALVVAAVGASRVYLGVHWPSDVLAGWTLGAAWALLCGLVAQALDRRGAVEPAKGPAEEA